MRHETKWLIRWALGGLATMALLNYAYWWGFRQHVVNVATVAIGVAPLTIIVSLCAHQQWGLRGLLTAILIIFIALALGHSWLRQHISWLYFLEHAGSTFFLALIFFRSLRAGVTPICTKFASRVHKVMTPMVVWYCRQLTLAWGIFFSVGCAVSILLFFLTPFKVWSLFANIIFFPLVVCMQVVSMLLRHHYLPAEDIPRLLESVMAFYPGRKKPTKAE